MKFAYGIASQVGGKIPIKPSDPKQLESHAMFFDYDLDDIKPFKDWLLQIQDDLHLSDIYLIKSSSGANAICLDIMPLMEIKRIGTDISSPCDRKYFELNAQRGYYTLRFNGADKTLAEVLPAEGRLPKSRAHKYFLEWFFSIKIIDDIWYDEGSWPAIIKFASAKHGYHREVREWRYRDYGTA
jgi:hypothetical protein